MSFNIKHIQRLAYWIWRGLPPGAADLEDVQQEAVIAAWRAREGCEIIAAKRAVFHFLRRWNRGLRQGCPMKMVPYKHNSAMALERDRSSISAEERLMVMRAVELLSVEQLRVVHALFYKNQTGDEIASELGITRAAVYKLRTSALNRLAQEFCFDRA